MSEANEPAEPADHQLPFGDRVAKWARETILRQKQYAARQEAEREEVKAEAARQRKEAQEGAHGSRAMVAAFMEPHADARLREGQRAEQRRQLPVGADTAAALDRARTGAIAAHDRRRRAQSAHEEASQRAGRAGAVVTDQCEKIVKLRTWRDALLDGEAQRILRGEQPEADPLLAERKIADAARHLAIYEKAQAEAAEGETKARAALDAAGREVVDAERGLARAIFVRDAAAAVREFVDAMQPVMAAAVDARVTDAQAIVAGWLDRDLTKGL